MSSDQEDDVNDQPHKNDQEKVKYTEQELKDMKEKFMMFDDDGGGGLTAEELKKCKMPRFLMLFLFVA